MKQSILFVALVLCMGATTQPSTMPTPKPSTRPSAVVKAAPAKPALKPNAPEGLKALWNRQDEIKAKRKAALSSELKAMEIDLVAVRTAKIAKGETSEGSTDGKKWYKFPNAELKKKKVDELQTAVNAVKATIAGLKDAFIYPDYDNSLADHTPFYGFGVKVLQVQDGQNMMVHMVGDLRDQDSWIKGLPTAGMTDGAEIKITEPLWVTGTKSFETVMGAKRTVKLVEPFRLDDYLTIDSAKTKPVKPNP